MAYSNFRNGVFCNRCLAVVTYFSNSEETVNSYVKIQCEQSRNIGSFFCEYHNNCDHENYLDRLNFPEDQVFFPDMFGPVIPEEIEEIEPENNVSNNVINVSNDESESESESESSESENSSNNDDELVSELSVISTIVNDNRYCEELINFKRTLRELLKLPNSSSLNQSELRNVLNTVSLYIIMYKSTFISHFEDITYIYPELKELKIKVDHKIFNISLKYRNILKSDLYKCQKCKLYNPKKDEDLTQKICDECSYKYYCNIHMNKVKISFVLNCCKTKESYKEICRECWESLDKCPYCKKKLPSLLDHILNNI